MEFGPKKGLTIFNVRSIYEPKSTGAAWRVEIVQEISDLGFVSCLAGPDVWIKSPQNHMVSTIGIIS